MITRFKLIVIALCLSVAGIATVGACSSSPEVPDQTQGNKPTYKSTKEGAEADQADGAEAGAQGAEAGQAQAAQGDQKATIPHAEGPIATIDGKPVPAERFNTEMKKIAESGQFPIQLLGKVKDQIIKKIVDKELVDRAVADADVDVSEDKLEERIKEIRAQFDEANQKVDGQMGSLDDLVEQLGISKEEFRQSVRESLAIEKLLIDRGMQYPTDQEIKDFYEQNKDAFKRPAQIHARHILVKVDEDAGKKAWQKAHDKAVEIRQKAVKDGTDFAELAKKTSDGPSKSRGGDLGWFGRGRMVPEFEEAAFALKKGEVSEPIRTQFGWHVVKKVDEREAGSIAYEDVKAQLENKLRNQRVQEALQGLLSDLRSKKKIELHPENVK